ncbi:MAG: GTPase Era [Myxococcota bacterium]|nr:GTPase Era [Myxococcota bacterium]
MSGEAAHRSGVVALLGRPNAGKSTLLNRLLGQKLAIVTAKPQTTRSRILGILTLPGAQLLLLDTPGFHEGGKALNRALNAIVERVVDDCDVAVLLVDPSRGWSPQHDALRAELERQGTPVLVVATQCDREAAARKAEALGADLQISARTGEGVDALLAALVERVPEGPPFYPEDEVTDRSLRFLSAELIREAVFEELGQELPYETAVEIMEFDERDPELIRIRARLLVERNSQVSMVVGQGGRMIKKIGTRARKALEALLETRVYLELRAKAEPRWSKRPRRLESLGYE